MNIQRKVRIQEKRISSLQDQLEKLSAENKDLLSKNLSLQETVAAYRARDAEVPQLLNAYREAIAELKEFQKKYQQLIKEARKKKLEYGNREESLLGRLRQHLNEMESRR